MVLLHLIHAVDGIGGNRQLRCQPDALKILVGNSKLLISGGVGGVAAAHSSNQRYTAQPMYRTGHGHLDVRRPEQGLQIGVAAAGDGGSGKLHVIQDAVPVGEEILRPVAFISISGIGILDIISDAKMEFISPFNVFPVPLAVEPGVKYVGRILLAGCNIL